MNCCVIMAFLCLAHTKQNKLPLVVQVRSLQWWPITMLQNIWGSLNPTGPLSAERICQITPLTLSVPTDDFSLNQRGKKKKAKSFPNPSRQTARKQDSCQHPRSKLACCKVKGLLSWPVTHHGSRGGWSFPFCLQHSPVRGQKRVSRTLLGSDNYPWGLWGAHIEWLNFDLFFKLLQQSRHNLHHWGRMVFFNQGIAAKQRPLGWR